MNIRKILFPTDFSQYNESALKLASTLAAESHATLYIIYVHGVQDLNVAMGEASNLYAPTWHEEQHEAERRLGEVLPTIAGVKYKHECLVGNPITQILHFAESNDVDLIVMASHGRTGLLRLLIGSVTEGVMRRAKCPVLVVRQPVDKENVETRSAIQTAKV